MRCHRCGMFTYYCCCGPQPKSWEQNSEHGDTVTLNVYLPKESFEALQRLQQLCGHDTIQETLRKALRLYGVVQRNGVVQIDR